MSKVRVFALAIAVQLGLLALCTVHAAVVRAFSRASLGRQAEVVRRLELTDLALFNDARYARHLSQADLSTAFQEHPLALEHFPAGSLAPPPDFGPRVPQVTP